MCCNLRLNRITGDAELCFVFVILNERQLKRETERQLRQNLLLLLKNACLNIVQHARDFLNSVLLLYLVSSF